MESLPGSLCGKSVAPLCNAHRPVIDLTEDGLVEAFCPYCGFYMILSIESYLDLIDNRPPEGDTFKEK